MWSSGWKESSGSGGVMGDSGRSRWSEGAGVVSAIYLERRFLNGALFSAVLKTLTISNLEKGENIILE